MRMKKIFNSLPKDIRNTTKVTVEKFKNQLNIFLCKIPDQPNIPGYRKPAQSNSVADQMLYMDEHQIGGEDIVALSSQSGLGA